jgi:osmotically-inducible protein OsmY
VTDEELARDVKDELTWDPKVDGDAVAVAAVEGIVTLRGTVGSLHEKRAAKKAAERVRGVVAVKDRLTVRLLIGELREDADLRGDVLQALMLDSLVPTTIDATVCSGVVTLTGMAEWPYQRDEAEFVAGNVPGVTAVENNIELDYLTDIAEDIADRIRKAFVRSARLDARRVEATTSNGTVTLSGRVHSCDEHDAAVAAAWAAPGVRKVDDRLTVTS